MKGNESSKAQKLLVLSVPAVFLISLSLYLNISGASYIKLWACPTMSLLGLACPFCGATRGVCAILTFRFYEAIQFNIAVFILFFILLCAYAFCLYKVIKYNKYFKIKIIYVLTFGTVFIIFFAVRNFSFYKWSV